MKPYHTLSTTTTAFHLASKPSLTLSVDKVATMFNLPDLHAALAQSLYCLQTGMPHHVLGVRSRENHALLFDCLQIWCKIHVQQMQYYDKHMPDDSQALRALPPSTTNPHGLYDAVIVNVDLDSNWPR